MDLSIRLKAIADEVKGCKSIADIGTDHGYIPMYLVKNGICETAIASDINKGPLEKAKKNIGLDGLKDRVKCYLGPGLAPLKVNEVEGIVIAGMGGNLTRDILLADMDKVKNYKLMVLQPAQNPEVLREFLYNNEYEIIDEKLLKDEGKYYELFTVRYNDNAERLKFDDKIYYEISPMLLRRKGDLLKEYIEVKIEHSKKVLTYIKEDTESANIKKQELAEKIKVLEEMIKCY